MGETWEVVKEENGCADLLVGTPLDGEGKRTLVAIVVPEDGKPANGKAQVIAAAPDLLASCKALVTALREYTDGHETPAQDAILSAAEAAIAKAGDEVD